MGVSVLPHTDAAIALPVQLTKFNQALIDYSGASDNPRTVDGIMLSKFDTVDDQVGTAVSLVYRSAFALPPAASRHEVLSALGCPLCSWARASTTRTSRSSMWRPWSKFS